MVEQTSLDAYDDVKDDLIPNQELKVLRVLKDRFDTAGGSSREIHELVRGDMDLICVRRSLTMLMKRKHRHIEVSGVKLCPYTHKKVKSYTWRE